MNSEGRRRLLTLEGMEGCGKTTQIHFIEEWLTSMGHSVLTLREPGGTPLGEAIRHLLKHDDSGIEMCPETELLLFAASRAELTRKRILPHLEAGGWVICDRFLDSTTIYQGRARNLPLSIVETINHFAVDSTLPGLTLVLDLPFETAWQRAQARRKPEDLRDRMEEEPESFYRQVSDAYRKLANQEPDRVRLISATSEPQNVFEQIKQEMSHAFPGILDS
ncbi:MAG: dTMP kinase [Verrucomicrobiota bacterium]